MPLLEQLSPKDSPKDVLEKIDKILGGPDAGDGGGPSNAYWEAKLYILDAGTGIDVHSQNGHLVFVALCTGPPEWKILKELYRVPTTGTDSN